MDGHQMKGLGKNWFYFSFLLKEVADQSCGLINSSPHGDGGWLWAPVFWNSSDTQLNINLIGLDGRSNEKKLSAFLVVSWFFKDSGNFFF